MGEDPASITLRLWPPAALEPESGTFSGYVVDVAGKLPTTRVRQPLIDVLLSLLVLVVVEADPYEIRVGPACVIVELLPDRYFEALFEKRESPNLLISAVQAYFSTIGVRSGMNSDRIPT